MGGCVEILALGLELTGGMGYEGWKSAKVGEDIAF